MSRTDAEGDLGIQVEWMLYDVKVLILLKSEADALAMNQCWPLDNQIES